MTKIPTSRPLAFGFAVALLWAFCLAVIPTRAESAASKPHYATPSSVRPWHVSCDGFGIEWAPSPYADFYVMRYSRSRSFRDSSYVRLTDPNVTHAEKANLPPGTRFYAKVAAANIEGQRLSSYSQTISLKTSPPCGSDNDD